MAEGRGWSKVEERKAEPFGFVVTREDASLLGGILGSPCNTLEQLKTAIGRCRKFSVAGTEITLDAAVLERLKTRSDASRAKPGEYLEREVKRLLASEVGL